MKIGYDRMYHHLLPAVVASEDPDRTPQAIALDDGLTHAYYNRALARSRSGDHDGELEDLRQAARLGHDGAREYLHSSGVRW